MVRMGQSTSRADAIYRRLRDDILNGSWAPGARLAFAEMSTRYGASSGVLREALPRLVEQGLATSESQLGYRVVTVSTDDLRHLTEARVAIESLVLRQSIAHGGLTWEGAVVASHHTLARTPTQDDAGRIDPAWLEAHTAFHRTLLDGCPNPRLREIAHRLRDVSEVYRCWAHAGGATRDVAAEHRRIADAAVSRDVETATAALTDHIELTTTLLLASPAAAGTD